MQHVLCYKYNKPAGTVGLSCQQKRRIFPRKINSISFESAESGDEVPSPSQQQGNAVLMMRGTIGTHNSSESDGVEQTSIPNGIEEIVESNNNYPQKNDHGEDDKHLHLATGLYKREEFDKYIKEALQRGVWRRDALLLKLKDMGITAFIIDSQHAPTIKNIMVHVNQVIQFVAKENRSFAPESFQRCLLFQDRHGMLHNLVFPSQYGSISTKWREHLENFSSFQAMLAVTILMKVRCH